MRQTLIKKSKESDLVLLEPGEYIRAGQGGQAMLKLDKPTQGLIIKTIPQARFDDKKVDRFAEVLVEGRVINVWLDNI